jgi:hypothetical protein
MAHSSTGVSHVHHVGQSGQSHHHVIFLDLIHSNASVNNLHRLFDIFFISGLISIFHVFGFFLNQEPRIFHAQKYLTSSLLSLSRDSQYLFTAGVSSNNSHTHSHRSHIVFCNTAFRGTHVGGKLSHTDNAQFITAGIHQNHHNDAANQVHHKVVSVAALARF